MEPYFERGEKLKDSSTTFNTHEKGTGLKDTSTIFNPHDEGARLKETSSALNPQAKEYQPTLVDSQQKPLLMQQQKQHAYRNPTQNNSQDVQLTETTKHGKTLSKPLLDNCATNKSKCHSVSTTSSN